jgi:hypothetical protein
MVSENHQATREPMHIFLGPWRRYRSTSPSALGFREQRGGAVLLRLKIPTLPGKATKALFSLPLFLLLCLTGQSQKMQPDEGSLPKFDLHTEAKTKGVVDEANLLLVGTRKDFTELIIRSGDDKVHIYVCPKPFQEETCISFSKGDRRHGFQGQAGDAGRDPRSRAGEGYGHTSIFVTTKASPYGIGAPASDRML